MTSGYQSLYIQHVMQADKGADFDFLKAAAATKSPAISTKLEAAW